MKSKSYANTDPVDIQAVNDALREARRTFLKGIRFRVEPTSTFETTVFGDAKSQQSTLFLNYESTLARQLRDYTNDWKEAWLLVFAHEAGHLRLNAICHANGADPAEPTEQLKAIGIESIASDMNHVADFQKESAIEAFCDASLAQVAIHLMGPRWRAAVTMLRNHREERSRALGFFKPDEYATTPALDAFLERDGKMEPKEAAKIALEHSIRQNSILKKRAIAAMANFIELKTSAFNRVEKWRKIRKTAKANLGQEEDPRPPSSKM